MSVAKANSKVRKKIGKHKNRRNVAKTFFADDGWRVVVSSKKCGGYEEIEIALKQVLEEVQLRIENNIQI